MTETDFEAFMTMLRFYFRHVCHYPRSLLARCYGIYEVKRGEQKSVKIMVMGNTLQARNKSNIKHIFDLKGSAMGRLVKGDIIPRTTLQDNNLKMLSRKEKFLRFSNHFRK